MVKTKGFLVTGLFVLLLYGYELSAQHNASWGRPPDGWDDFYLGLVNDYKKNNAVGETGYWLDVIDKANDLSTYNATDPNKKSVLYQYKYINAGVDTSTNWNVQKSLPPYGMDLLDGMRYDADQVGMRCAWVIYMMQEDGGSAVARDNIANAAWLKNYFLNIKYVAETGAGRKEIFIIEPDLFGYIIQSLYNAGVPATGMTGGIGLGMPAPISTIAADPDYSYLAGLSNDFRGVVQGIIRTIRRFNSQAYCGVAVNLWSAWTPINMTTPVPPRNGLVWWSTAQIDAAIAYQSAFYQSLLLGSGYDKGDFLVPEKNGFPAYLAVGGQTHWMWGDEQMENYLYFFERMGKSVCLPLVAWQVSLGQSNRAATFGITLTNPPAAPFVPLPNASQGYEDTYVQYMFNNIDAFIDAGFIGFLGGKGMPQGTDYSLQTGYGDKGFFFNQARTVLDPGRPWNLFRGPAIPDLGGDTTLCGTGGSLILNPGNMGASPILWSTGETSQTITVNSPGIYWVEVGGTECARRDSIVVSNTYTVFLGTDQNLCSEGSIVLDAGHAGVDVSYIWKKDGIILSLDTTRYLNVSVPGTYRIEVTDPSCMPVKSDEIVISTDALTTNSGVCVNMPASATLSVTNTGGTYRWYSDPVGGSPLATGNSFNTPVLGTETTYYVADEALYNTTIISKTAGNGFSNSPNNGNPEAATDNDWLYFDVLEDIQLVSLNIEAILYWSTGTQSATLIISNPTTGFNYSQSISYTTPIITSGPTRTTGILNLPSPLNVPAATGYRIRVDAAYSLAYYKGSLSNVIHPKTHSDLLTTTGYSCASGCAIAGMPALFDWNVRAASTCVRTPVTVRDCDVLPVNFIYLKAEKLPERNRISWLIEETNEPGVFEAQRSLDGVHFESLSSGIFNFQNHYIAYDEDHAYHLIYYRIRQTDPDGTITYSQTVSVSDDENKFTLNVFPNPSAGNFNISVYPGDQIAAMVLQIFSSTGKLLVQKEISPGINYLLGNDLSPGLYLLKISDGHFSKILKLVKE